MRRRCGLRVLPGTAGISSRERTVMDELLLVIGNKNYSSWSLRAWIGLRLLGIPFREQHIVLDRPDTQAQIRRFSAAGLVPVLVDAGVTVYESLAILEYLNEVHGEGRMLPAGRRERAQARSACAEMHAGFSHLRQALPMNLARDPAPPRDSATLTPAVGADIARILTLWEELLGRSPGPYLFGERGMADCMYLPVVTRFHTYAVDTSAYPLSTAYAQRMLALPEYQEWAAAARAEAELQPAYDR